MSAASADRNLLLGILAVQLDFVTKDALLAAMNAWLLDKATPLGDILCDRGDLSPERLQLLTALVAEHLKQHGDDAQQSLAALSGGEAIRRSLAAVADADVRASLGHVGGDRHDARTTVDFLTGPAARYEILRPHARGGLGEVFVAEDTELHRPVALKEIQPQHADDPDSRARFVLEAEITGGLEHPGVVPVYGLGSYADGRPFYAMRFIRGDNLQQAVKRFHAAPPSPFDSLAFRQLLRRFVDVCNAVAYAHSRGVLHRDLKPGNVMLGRYGETLVVDWGLAKVIGRATDPMTDGEPTLRPYSGAESSETVAGRALGTPAYMSPEQAAGRLDELGTATDVYSLGATLYEVLTGRPPFGESDLDGVQKGLFPPPRQAAPAVPRPLERVCLKAMALRPQDRYASPLALAADVERWLADEPLTAYREPVAARARRWVRKHSRLATGAAAALAVGVAGLGLLAAERERARQAVAAEQAQTARERDAKDRARLEAEGQRDAAQRERDRAVAARRRTRQALDAMVSGVTGDALTTQKELSAEQKRFLEGVLGYYEEFAAEPGEDREARERLAAAHYRLAVIRYRLGQVEPAVAVLRRAAELYAGLASGHPGAPEYRTGLALSHRSLGLLFNEQGKHKEAAAADRTALDLWEKLAADHPGVPGFRSLVADGHDELGVLLAGQGQWTEAEREFRTGLAGHERLVADHPGVPGYRRELAGHYVRVARILTVRGKTTEAEAACRAALAAWERLAAEYPAVPDYRFQLADSRGIQGQLLFTLGRWDQGKAMARDAAASWEQLVVEYPGVREYREGLAGLYTSLAHQLIGGGEMAEAEAVFRSAAAAWERLAADNPTVPRYAVQLSNTSLQVGERLHYSSNDTAALEWYTKAVESLTRIVTAHPRQADARGSLLLAYAFQATGFSRVRRNADALAAWDKALALDKDLALSPVRGQLRLGRLITTARLGQHAQAVAEAEAEVKGASFFLGASTHYNAACVYAGAVEGAAGDAALAERYAARAVQLLRQAVAKGYRAAAEMRTDRDLDPLRRRNDFAALLWDMAELPAR